LRKISSATPIVFTAVSFPLEMDLNASEGLIEADQLTGVKEATDFTKELEVLRNKAKTVLLVYDPTSPTLTSHKEEIENDFGRYGNTAQNGGNFQDE
jgi:ABC-type uncharacterized transport system substrate-binding protein